VAKSNCQSIHNLSGIYHFRQTGRQSRWCEQTGYSLKFQRPYSIRVLVLMYFIAVALVPVSILGIKLYKAAWDNAWREIDEKHKVLAKNLSAPILILKKSMT